VKNFGKFYRYIVRDRNSILLLINIFNGNIFLDKRKIQLKKWLDIFNIIELNNKVRPNLNDSWISGLIDAEGCFNSNIFQRKTMKLKYQIKLRFMIDQKDCLNNMLYLKDVLHLFLTYRRCKNNTKNMHRIESNSLIKIPLIINYLDKFNLKTKKKESYYKWKEIYKMILDKQHLNEDGLKNIRNLSKQINIITSQNKKIGNK